MNEWKADMHASIINQKTVIAQHGEQSLQYKTTGNITESSEAPAYACTHVEADTSLAYHLSVLSGATPGANVIVRATDTDIMTILLYHAKELKANIWMEVGHSADSTRANITQLANHLLGAVLCKAIWQVYMY